MENVEIIETELDGEAIPYYNEPVYNEPVGVYRQENEEEDELEMARR